MRYSLSREAFLKPLQQVVNVVERRQTLPVLANLLVHAGILPESERIEIPTPPQFVTVTGPEHFVYAGESGVWEPTVELGQTVTEGQIAARIYTPETPWRAPTVMRFQAGGLVLCKRIPGRTTRGDCLFHLGA